MSDTANDLIYRMDFLKHHISSINALNRYRLSSHGAVRVICQGYCSIFKGVDYDAQHAALSDISYLTLSYRQRCFAEFHARLPHMIRQGKKARAHATLASKSLRQAASEVANLAESVKTTLAHQEEQAKHCNRKHRQECGKGTAQYSKIAEMIMGHLTSSIGDLWCLVFRRNAHSENAQNNEGSQLQGVHEVLQSRILPAVQQAEACMTAVAAFLDHLVINLDYMLILEAQRIDQDVPGSELQQHYETMKSIDIMTELHTAVDSFLVVSKQAVRQLQLEL